MGVVGLAVVMAVEVAVVMAVATAGCVDSVATIEVSEVGCDSAGVVLEQAHDTSNTAPTSSSWGAKLAVLLLILAVTLPNSESQLASVQCLRFR
jgi:hypothetical protein